MEVNQTCVYECVWVCISVYVCRSVPGLDPSGTEPLKMLWVNSGLLSFWSMTLMTMSMGFSTWFPFVSTAWARNWTQTHSTRNVSTTVRICICYLICTKKELQKNVTYQKSSDTNACLFTAFRSSMCLLFKKPKIYKIIGLTQQLLRRLFLAQYG